MVGVVGQPEPVDGSRRPGRRPRPPVSFVRRSVKAMSSRTVGITIWVSGSVKMKPTSSRTRLPCRATDSPSTVTLPPVGLDQAVDHPGQRRLAGPVRPDDADPALGQGQVDVGRAPGAVAEGVVDMLEPDLVRVIPPPAAAHREPPAGRPSRCPGRRRSAQAARPNSGPPGRSIRWNSRTTRMRAGRTPGVAHRDGAAVGADRVRVQVQRAGRGQDLGGEGLGDLDRTEVGRRQPEPGQQRRHRCGRPEAGQCRDRSRGPRRPGCAGAGRRAAPVSRDRGGTVGDAARIAGGVRAGGGERRPQPGQPLGGEAGARALVVVQAGDRHQLVVEGAAGRAPGSCGRTSGPPRRPASLAADAELRGQRVGGRAHLRVRERRRGERGPGVAARRRWRRTSRRSRWRSDGGLGADRPAPGPASPGGDPGPALQDRVQPRTALPVDGDAGDRRTEAGPQRGDPGQVPARAQAVARGSTSSTGPVPGPASSAANTGAASASTVRPASACPAVPIGRPAGGDDHRSRPSSTGPRQASGAHPAFRRSVRPGSRRGRSCPPRCGAGSATYQRRGSAALCSRSPGLGAQQRALGARRDLEDRGDDLAEPLVRECRRWPPPARRAVPAGSASMSSASTVEPPVVMAASPRPRMRQRLARRTRPGHRRRRSPRRRPAAHRAARRNPATGTASGPR